MALFALFGGTFDPIHNGHILPLNSAAEKLSLSTITLLPCFVSPHKSTPTVSTNHRLNMLRLAIEGNSLFSISDYETKRAKPSYTVQTLRYFKHLYPTRPLLFIMGADAFKNLTHWYQWEVILELSNILVLARPGFDRHVSPQLVSYMLPTATELLAFPWGKVAFIDSPLFDISSTQIRENLREQKDLSELIPQSVLNYIKVNHLYT